MTAALLASFLNTGVAILVIDGNFEYAPFPLNYIPIRNKISDLDKVFYSKIPQQL